MRAEYKYGAIFLAILVLFVGWRWLGGGSDERRIDRQLQSLVAAASVSEGESHIQALAAGRRLVGFFVPGATVEYLPNRSLEVREEAVIGARTQMREGRFRASGHTITIDGTGNSANSVVSITGNVAIPGDTMRGSHRYAIDWAKHEGEWLIRRVTHLE